MSRRISAAATALLCALVAPAAATPIALVDPNTGTHSGWKVTLEQAAVGVSVLGVSVSAGTLTITVDKEYVGYEQEGDDVEFPKGILTFSQVKSDCLTMPTIAVRSETILNDTGLGWTGFYWFMMNPGAARFDTGASGAWDTSPFASASWQNAGGGLADGLLTSNGTAPAPQRFLRRNLR